MTRRTPRRTVVLSLLLLGGLSVLSATPTWLSTTASTALDPSVAVSVSGTTAAPGVSAAALVVVAAALSLGLVGRVARWVSLAVVALGGAVIGGSALSFVLSPDAAARSGVADATGVATTPAQIDLSPAPYVTVLLGAAVLLVAVWAAFARVDWAQRSRRYDTRTAPSGHGADAAHGTRAAGAAGTVPAVGAVGAVAAAGPAVPSGAESAALPAPEAAHGADPDARDERDTWDALTQGDDPT